MMKAHHKLRLAFSLLFLGMLIGNIGAQESHAVPDDPWWDINWPYRIPLQVNESGPVSATLNFSEVFDGLGLVDVLLDLRSLQVVPYFDGIPGDPVPFDETFSQLIIDADEIIVPASPDDMYWAISEESTFIAINDAPKTQGDGSLHAHIEISEESQTKTGFYFDFNDSSLGNWSNYEVLLYDIYPLVSEAPTDDLFELFSFKLEGLMKCPNQINGPDLTNNIWNGISLPLQPFGMCDCPDYSSIDKMRFLFEKASNSYLEIGDILDLWVDNFRMFDQDADGQILWNADENVDIYYLYFDLLRYKKPLIYLPLVVR